MTDRGMPITGYRVYFGHSPDALTRVEALGNMREYTRRELVNGDTCYFAVSAVNSNGEGPRCAAQSAVPLGVPGAPRNLTLTVAVDHVELRWRPPTDAGASPFLEYVVLRGPSKDALMRLTTSPLRDTLEYIDSDVELGAILYYSVMAINPYGVEGPRTDCEDVLVAVPPGEISNLSASAGDGWVDLTWTAPATTWGLPITGYIVLKGTVLDGMLEVAFPRDPNHRDVFVDNGITYHYAVRAVTIAGAGDFGLIVNATPQGRPIAPGGFSAHYAGGKVVLRWEQPTGPCAPVTGYVLLKGTYHDKMVLLAELGLVTEYIDKDIEPGHSYYYSVRAASEIGEGATTEPVSVSVPRDLGLLKTTTIALVLLLALLLIVLVARWRRARAIEARTGLEEEPKDEGTGAGEALPGSSNDEHPIGEIPKDVTGERASPSGGDASRPGGIPGAGSESSTSKRP